MRISGENSNIFSKIISKAHANLKTFSTNVNFTGYSINGRMKMRVEVYVYETYVGPSPFRALPGFLNSGIPHAKPG